MPMSDCSNAGCIGREREADPHIPEPLHGDIAVLDGKFSDLQPVTPLAVLPNKNQKNRSPRLQCYGVTAQNDRAEPMMETGGLSGA
jgi:hypothetical protein